MPALRRQVEGHLKQPGFTLVVVYAGGTPVGFGYALPCSADYWFGPPGRAGPPRAPARSG